METTKKEKMIEKMYKLLVLIFCLLGVTSFILAQQIKFSETVFAKYGVDNYSVVFWNIENFFDLMPSLGSVETGFTPRGEMHWTRNKFNKKRDGLAKVIIATGLGGELPTIIGLAEIENRYVLNQLLYETPLFYGNYRIVHKDSQDRRGIDVALFYRRDLFRALHTQWIQVKVDELEFSRDILYVKGVLHELDTIHLFVNHWPSKFGGEKVSGPKRLVAAKALARVCDSLFQVNSNANILAMGDFNDTPDSKAFGPLKDLLLLEHNHDRLKVNQEMLSNIKNNINIGDNSNKSSNIYGIVNLKGTIKYRGVWEKIDHFFVSKNILNSNEPISVCEQSVITYGSKHLLEKDKTYIGTKPRRTYIGPRYNGGLSDHLPIILKIKRNW